MDYPLLITRLPQAEVPFPGIDAYMLRSEDGLLVFFDFTRETIVPPHAHGAQWGTVLEGAIELTIGGMTRTYGPGDSYVIGAGEVHEGTIPAGVKVIDFFEEPDRYLPRRSQADDIEVGARR